MRGGLYRQYELQSGDSTLVCWLQVDRRLKPDTHLTLKETGDRLWRVIRTFDPAIENPPFTKWQVGGLA